MLAAMSVLSHPEINMSLTLQVQITSRYNIRKHRFINCLYKQTLTGQVTFCYAQHFHLNLGSTSHYHQSYFGSTVLCIHSQSGNAKETEQNQVAFLWLLHHYQLDKVYQNTRATFNDLHSCLCCITTRADLRSQDRWNGLQAPKYELSEPKSNA